MYKYEEQKQKIFTEENQKLFLEVRDYVHKLIDEAGAFTMRKAFMLPDGIDAAEILNFISWEMMACVDRLVELGEIKEIPTTTQDRLFIAAAK